MDSSNTNRRRSGHHSFRDNKVRTGKTTSGHECGSICAADPDARRTRASYSLADKRGGAAPKLNGHCLRRSNLLSSTMAVTRWRCVFLQFKSRRQLKRFTTPEHCPGHERVLGRDGDHRTPVAAALSQGARPLADAVAFAECRVEYRSGAQYQQTSQVTVSGLGDALLDAPRVQTAVSVPSTTHRLPGKFCVRKPSRSLSENRI